MKYLLAAIIVIGTGTSAHAHKVIPTGAMPQGWIYPSSCCGGNDCREVPDIWVKETMFGYTILNEAISSSDPRLKRSLDEHYHWCTVGGTVYGNTICLFVPDRAY